MKKIIYLCLLFPVSIYCQVVITDKSELNTTLAADPSAILDVRNSTKGISFPEVALNSTTDAVTISGPVEGLSALNTSTNSSNSNIPVNNATMTVWDGSKWLFYFSNEDIGSRLDVINTFVASSGNNPVVFTSFPSVAPAAVNGDLLGGDWKILVNTNSAVNGEPRFNYAPADATQRLVIDAEGMATINSSSSSAADFGYEVGLFIDNSLVAAKKYFQPVITSASCSYSKYNITIIIDEQRYFTKPKGSTYNIILAARPLPRSNNNYNRLVFGGGAGSGCNNLNADSARAYLDILTIEKKN